MTAFSSVDLYRLGAGTLLHARASGALVLAGDKALAAARAAQTAQAAGRPPPEEGAAVLTEWERAGLFQDARAPFPDPVAWREPAAAPLELALGPRRVVLRCEGDTLAADLATVLAPLRSHGRGPAAARVDVLSERDGYGVFRDRVACWGRAEVLIARYLALREVVVALHGPRRVGAVLHAASVARDGRALVLAGPSGAGKSTLAMGLLGEGWAPVADDLTALDRRGRVLPFPTRLSLKAGSWPLAPQAALAAAPERAIGGGHIRYLDAPGAVPGAVAPAALVFPRYVDGAAVTVEPLSPEEALVRLVDTGSRLAGLPETAAPLVRFLRATPSVALTHGGGAAARAACAALLDGSAEAA